VAQLAREPIGWRAAAATRWNGRWRTGPSVGRVLEGGIAVAGVSAESFWRSVFSCDDGVAAVGGGAGGLELGTGLRKPNNRCEEVCLVC
jgi:hypothetical protein